MDLNLKLQNLINFFFLLFKNIYTILLFPLKYRKLKFEWEFRFQSNSDEDFINILIIRT